MEDFRKSVTYDEELPRPHSEVVEYVEEERPSSDRGLLGDIIVKFGKGIGGGGLAGLGTSVGLQELGAADYVGSLGDLGLTVGVPVAGAAAGGYVAFKKHESDVEEVNKWRRAQDLEETSDDFSDELEDQDLVVVRDYLLGEGEPVERTGEVAAALYNEASGVKDTQYKRHTKGSFSDIEYQLSLFDGEEPVRTFYVGDGIIEDDEISSSDIEVDSFIEDNLESAVPLEEYR